MKTLILFTLVTLMGAPVAFGFGQQDLDQLESFEDLTHEKAFDMQGIQYEGRKKVDDDFFGRRRFRCTAENRRGRRFRGEDRKRQRARRKAMRRCRQASRRPRSCEVIRCRRRGGELWNLIEIIDQF